MQAKHMVGKGPGILSRCITLHDWKGGEISVDLSQLSDL